MRTEHSSASKEDYPNEDLIKIDSFYSPTNLLSNKFTLNHDFRKDAKTLYNFYNTKSNNRSYEIEKDYKNQYNVDYKLNSDYGYEKDYNKILKQTNSEQQYLEDKYFLSASHKHQKSFEKLDKFNRKIINIKTKLDDISNGM